jgi:hypothetical protein
LGRLDEARRCVNQMRTLAIPAGDVFAPVKRRNPDWHNQMTELLRKAGA